MDFLRVENNVTLVRKLLIVLELDRARSCTFSDLCTFSDSIWTSLY